MIWRSTGLRAAGRALVRALGSEDEDLRTIAGMFLVKAGKDSEPLLEEALNRRENLPMVLWILGDIGDSRLEPEIRQFSDDLDPRVAGAARDALEGLRDHTSADREIS
jgi:HEAT repeat protein